MLSIQRRVRLAASLLTALVAWSSSATAAAQAPAPPRPLVLTLEVERQRKLEPPRPVVLTVIVERETASEAPDETGSDEGVTWDSSGEVSTEDYEACLAKAPEFTKQCDEVAHRWATQDCERSNHQSNCANWKVGCFSPFTPYSVFSEIGCSSPGFYRCAAATYPGYLGCVDGCNTAKDRGACLNERCQAQARISFRQCGEATTAESTWKEPVTGSPDAQPGTDENAIAATTSGATTAAGGLGTMSEAGKGALTAGSGLGGFFGSGGRIRKGNFVMLPPGWEAAPPARITFPDGRIPTDEVQSAGQIIHAGGIFIALDPGIVELPDGTQVSLVAGGQMRYDPDPHQVNLYAGMGSFHHDSTSTATRVWRDARAVARKTVRFLRVVTSGVMAVLGGTQFVLDTDPEARTDRILLREGSLDVRGNVSGVATLVAGQQVTARDGILGRPSPMTEADWAAAQREIESSSLAPARTAAGGASATGDATGGMTAAAPPGSTGAAASGACAGIHGRWRWFNGVMVECHSGGRCEASNGFGGPWRCLDPSGRFEIQWSRAGQQTPYVDTVTLSPDGWELQGVNQSGQGVGGQRPEFTGGDPQTGCQALVGNWRWSGGAVVECRSNGTCTNSHGLSGPWRCVNDQGRFEIRWTRDGRPDQLFVDTFLMSPLGTYLTGKNQYGVGMGAVRE